MSADKNNWHVGHHCLNVLENLYPRRDLLITTLLDSYDIDKGQEDEVDSCYVVGYVSSKTPRIFCKDNQNTFNPICMPYAEYAARPQDKIKNQHIRD